MKYLFWFSENSSRCKISRRTFNRLKIVNPSAYNWIIRKTIYNYKNGLPLDFPEDFAKEEIKQENRYDDCELFVLEILKEERQTMSRLLIRCANRFSRRALEVTLKNLLDDDMIEKKMENHMNVFYVK